MTRLRLALATAGLALSLVPARGFAVTNAVVGTCKAGTLFTTIQAAVNAATAGSTIQVCPGTYAEQITITTPLTLKGVPAGAAGTVVIQPPAAGLSASSTSEIFGNLYANVYVHGTEGVTLNNLVIQGNGGGPCINAGFSIGVLNQGGNGLVTNSLFVNSAPCQHSIAAMADATIGFRFINNTFSNCGLTCLEVDYADTTTVTGNSLSASQNAYFVIELQYLSGPATISNNTLASDTIGVAILSTDSTEATISNNTILEGATGVGIGLVESTHNLVEGNRVTGGTALLINDYMLGYGNTIKQNTVTGAVCGLSKQKTSSSVIAPNSYFTTQRTTCK